jgi:hypothetical protein
MFKPKALQKIIKDRKMRFGAQKNKGKKKKKKIIKALVLYWIKP